MRIPTLSLFLSMLVLGTLFVGGSAFAHDGPHLHPHGIEYGWIIAAAAGLAVGYVVARIRGRK
jgi:hypothetical protein